MYDRKMMARFIKQKCGVSVGKNKIDIALSKVTSHYHQRKKSNTARMTSPTSHAAIYFGNNLHLHQNEKLEMYDVTNMAAIDGLNRFSVAGATMLKKYNIKTYEDVYRYC